MAKPAPLCWPDICRLIAVGERTKRSGDGLLCQWRLGSATQFSPTNTAVVVVYLEGLRYGTQTAICAAQKLDAAQLCAHALGGEPADYANADRLFFRTRPPNTIRAGIVAGMAWESRRGGGTYLPKDKKSSTHGDNSYLTPHP